MRASVSSENGTDSAAVESGSLRSCRGRVGESLVKRSIHEQQRHMDHGAARCDQIPATLPCSSAEAMEIVEKDEEEEEVLKTSVA